MCGYSENTRRSTPSFSQVISHDYHMTSDDVIDTVGEEDEVTIREVALMINKSMGMTLDIQVSCDLVHIPTVIHVRSV